MKCHLDRMLTVGMLLVLLLGGVGCGKAADVRPEIQAQYDAMNAAWGKRDSRAMMEFCDETYVFTSSQADQKPTDKKASVAALENFVATVPKEVILSSATTITAVELRDGQAVAQVETTRKLQQPNPQPGRPRNVETITASTDTWKKSPGGWKLVSSRQLKADLRIDGKAFPIGPRAAPPATSPQGPGAGSPAAPPPGSPAIPATGSPAAPTTGSPAIPATGSPAAPTTGSPAIPATGSPAAPTTGSPASGTP